MKNRTRSARRSCQTALFLGAAALPLQSVFLQPALAQANQNDTIRVTLNGRAINFGPVAPMQQAGRVLVPLRGVFEALGAFVDYNNATQSITATRGDTRVQLTIGSARAYVNGAARALDVPAQVQSGRTLVPLRFVSEALGATVLWNDAQRQVLITTPVPVDNGGNGTDNGNGNGGTVPVVNNVSGTVALVDDTAPGSVTIRVLDANTTATDPPRNVRYPLAANARLFRRTTGRLVRGQTPVYDASIALGTPLTRLSPGEDVSLQLNASGEVSRITSSVSLVAASIRDVQNDQIILDDTQGTTLTVGPNLRVVDERGRQSSDAGTLSPGQQVVLFIAPSTRRVFKVSALSTDLTLAQNAGNGSAGNGSADNGDNNGGDNNGGDNTLPDDGTGVGSSTGTGDASGTPQINLVQHNATRPLRAGQTLSVAVRGTPGQRATFSVLPDVPEIPMDEDPNRAGVYTGTYVVQTGDSVLNGRVSATLRNSAGREGFRQSQSSVTIDTVAPRITSTSPASGSTISSSQSNIVINATDVGGSGLGGATVSFNGRSVATEDITVSSNSVSVIAPNNLSGQVSVVVSVSDRAGNQARRTFSYFVSGNGGNGSGNGGNNSGNGIISLTHNATRDMQPGDRVTVNLRAAAGGSASFDVLGSDNSVLLRNVRMTETADGRYRGTFSIPSGDASQLSIRGRFTDANGQVSTEETTAPIILNGNGNAGNGNAGSDNGTNNGDAGNDVNNNQAPLTISTPGDGATVGRTLTVRGAAEANATVEVSVVAQGTRYLIFEYSNDLGTQQVQANSRGAWTTNAINLPAPANVSNLKYMVTATQTDGSNRRSEPVTITVTPRSSGSGNTGNSNSDNNSG